VRTFLLSLLAGVAGFVAARWASGSSLGPSSSRASNVPQFTSAAKPSPSTPAPSPPPSLPEKFAKIKNPASRLGRALDSRDVAGSARNLQIIIDALTPDDFAQLSRSFRELNKPQNYGFSQEFSTLLMDALVERWLAVDERGLFAALPELIRLAGEDRLAGHVDLLAALARARPAEILPQLLAKSSGGFFDRVQHLANSAIAALARSDENAARKFLDLCTSPEQRRALDAAIATGIAERDPVAAVTHALRLSDDAIFHAAVQSAARFGGGRVTEVIAAGGGKFQPHLATELALRFPDAPWSTLPEKAFPSADGITIEAFTAARWLDLKQVQRILELSASYPPALKSGVQQALVARWACEDPAAALPWAATRWMPAESGASAAGYALTTWLRQDAAAARAWVESQPPSRVRDYLADRLSELKSVSAAPPPTLETYVIDSRPKSDVRLFAFAQEQAAKRPADTAAWLMNQPDNVDIGKSLHPVMRQWFTQDPTAAAKWIQAQPVGLRRDRAITGFAFEAARNDPGAGAEWVQSIANPEMRREAAGHVFTQMAVRDENAARTWLDQLPGVDPRWRTWFLRAH
jgi:hypothetical protein